MWWNNVRDAHASFSMAFKSIRAMKIKPSLSTAQIVPTFTEQKNSAVCHWFITIFTYFANKLSEIVRVRMGFDRKYLASNVIRRTLDCYMEHGSILTSFLERFRSMAEREEQKTRKLHTNFNFGPCFGSFWVRFVHKLPSTYCLFSTFTSSFGWCFIVFCH